MSLNSTPSDKTTTRFVEASRSQVGVRFVAQGRNAFASLDCVGLVIVAAQIAGISPAHCSDYNFASDYSSTLLDYLSRSTEQVDVGDIRPGDVLAFWMKKREKPRHVGIVVDGSGQGTELNFVHTSESVGRVVESTLDKKWHRHIHSAWRFHDLI